GELARIARHNRAYRRGDRRDRWPEPVPPVDIRNNPLPPELLAAVDAGENELQAFLTALAEAATPVSEAKLVLVGEGAVGKSSLLAALRGDTFQPHRPQTHGLEIKDLYVGDAQPITLHAWDFGGQQHYRPTHQLFFTEPAVYVIVWKPREGAEQGMVEEWLEAVRNRAGHGVRALIVASHGGPESDAADLDRERLRDRFGKMIVDFYEVDSAQPDDRLECLRAAINATARALPHIHRTYPTAWMQVLEAVAAQPKQALSYEGYEAIARSHGLSEVAARSLARNAHALGTWIFYNDSEALADLVVTKPDWLSVAIAKVLDDGQVQSTAGLVEHRDLSRLWRDYTAPQRQQFLVLMERFELSYRVPEVITAEPTSLIAQLVPANRPDLSVIWDSFQPGETPLAQLCKVVGREAGEPAEFADSVVFRLIVRLHEMRLTDPAGGLHWRNGMVLAFKYGARALVTRSHEGILIQVKGLGRDAMLGLIASEVESCVASFWKGLEVNRYAICGEPCRFGGPGKGQFDFAKLLEAQDAKEPKVQCQQRRCTAWPSPTALLHDITPPQLDQAQVDQIVAAVNLGGLPTDEMRARMASHETLLMQLLNAVSDEAREGPGLFTLIPLDPIFTHLQITSTRARLTLYCEHSRLPVGILGNDPNVGVYDIDIPRGWWLSYGPALHRLMSLLPPLIGTVAGFGQAGNPDLPPAFTAQVAAARESAALALKVIDPLVSSDQPTVPHQAGLVRAEGGWRRQLCALLAQKDPGFADLRRVRGRMGGYLWVHNSFVHLYDAPLPEMPNA
ncbi:MAG: COR domain-containing protein, partial [Candidatus Nanopelagicales bacterium]